MGQNFPSPVPAVGGGIAMNAQAITPSDTSDLTNFSWGLYIGASGDVVVDTVGGQTNVKFTAVPQGVILPVAVKRLRSTTTATGIVALWS